MGTTSVPRSHLGNGIERTMRDCASRLAGVTAWTYLSIVMLTFAVSTKNRERLLDGDIAEAFLPSGAQAGRRAKFALGRALYSGWNAAGSLGEREEFPAKRWQACGLLNQAADGNGHRLVLSSNPAARSACGVGFTVKWLISACCHFRISRPT